MNLDCFVVVPNKPSSMKLKGRSLPEVQLDAVQLDQESRIIESRLQQLREDMSREKEEREKSGGYRWKSVKATSLGVTKPKENSFQKLSAGKVKMRVLKGEPEGPPRPAGKVPRPPPGEQEASRKPRLREKPCGQCEARAARLMCAECGEDYCVGCFARFHQKGALKNHRMIPIQMEIQTSISALDVVSQFKRQIEPEGSAVNSKRKDVKWSQGALRSKPSPLTPPHTQLSFMKKDVKEEEREEEEVEEGRRSQSLLDGAFDEKESERSFQEALWEWRRESAATEPGAGPEQEMEAEPEQEVEPGAEPEEMWGLTEPLKVSTEVFTGQADLVQKVEFEVEFKEHGLSYMEKLLVKKHRRTPIEDYRPLPSVNSYQESPMDNGPLTDEEGLTAEELEMQRYCASLFAPDPAPTAPTSTSTSSTSSNQHEHPAKSQLSMVELEQMAGDSAVLNSTFTAELEMDSGMRAEAEGVPMEPGHQESKKIKEPCRPYAPTTPPTRSPMIFNQLARTPVPTFSPQKRRSHLTPTPLTPTPPSPRFSTSRSARARISCVETKPTLRKASWSAPCKLGPPQSAVSPRQPSPSPLSPRPKSSGSSVPNPLPSKFTLTGSSPPGWTTRAKTTLSSPSTPQCSISISGVSSSSTLLSFSSMSIGSMPPTPRSSRDYIAESPQPDFTSRSKTAASPPSTAQSSNSISTGSSTPTPLSSRDKITKSPPPNFTSRSKTAASPPPIAQSSHCIPTGSSTPTPLSSRDKITKSPPPDFTSRSETAAPPPFTSRSSHCITNGSSTSTPLPSGNKTSESPPPDFTSRSKTAASPPPIARSPHCIPTGLSTPTSLSSRDKTAESPPPDFTSRSKTAASPPSTARSSRSISNGPSQPREKTPKFHLVQTPPEPNLTYESYDSPALDLISGDKSTGLKSPQQTLKSKPTGSTPPTPRSSIDKSPLSPELDFTDNSSGSAVPELNFRDNSPLPPVSQLDFRDKSPGSTLHEQDLRDESSRSPKPELSFRDKSFELPPLELASKYNSTESLPATPLFSRLGSHRPPPFEQVSMSQMEPHTPPKTSLSVRLPSASLSEHAQFVLTEMPQPPPLLKVATTSRLSPTPSSASQPRGESAFSSELPSSRLELSPHPGFKDEELCARAAFWAQGHCEQMGRFPQAPKASLGSDQDASLNSGLDSERDIGMSDQPVFFPDPSLALHNLAFPSARYTGLDGFLTLGLDSESDVVPPRPSSVRKSQECQAPAESLVGGPGCWRPGSSLRDCADEQLVLGVMRSQPGDVSPRSAEPRQAASPLQRIGFSGAASIEGRSCSATNTPRAGRPISADLSARPTPRPSPRPRPQSSPWPRPQSRAAKEIMEIESLGRMESEDPLLGDEEDSLALANLEEEFRLMSRRGTCSSDPKTSSSLCPRGGTEAGRQRTRCKRRKGSGEGRADEEEEEEEEEALRDKQNVASLP